MINLSDCNGAAHFYCLPPGVDFTSALLAGLEERMSNARPEDFARARIFLGTRRGVRALIERFHRGPARLLPQMDTIDALLRSDERDQLAQRLELAELVSAFLRSSGGFAPQETVVDLAETLAKLLGELDEIGKPPTALSGLDVERFADHWKLSRDFLALLGSYIEARGNRLSVLDRARNIVRTWQQNPPDGPVIIAGSTGSRRSTAEIMIGVAAMQHGAVILPGFDRDSVRGWLEMTSEHPQDVFKRLSELAGYSPEAVMDWRHQPPENPQRNRLISLALYPAPATDEWQSTAPRLKPELPGACASVSLIEAKSPRSEALAIAVAIRETVEEGKRVALISPDRQLTRRVAAALERWRIVPDDSAGRPLSLTPPGMFLRQVAAIIAGPISPVSLLALLKHPLTASARGNRRAHLGHTRWLESRLRGPFPDVDFDALRNQAEEKNEGQRLEWLGWVEGLLNEAPTAELPVHGWMDRLLGLATAFAAGTGAAPGESGELWEKAAGQALHTTCQRIRDAATGQAMSADLFRTVLRSAMKDVQVTDEAVQTHPLVSIWGILEARVQTADRVILGGLNEGIWPGTTEADPWLSRSMRAQIGLSDPQTFIGLAAHDFQQAAAGAEVILSRSSMDGEAETVSSRWVVRLTNLIAGMEGEQTPILDAMRKRGERFTELASKLEAPLAPIPPAHRPSPVPPRAALPERLSVTEIERLIRDPYAIYARRVLDLERLDPLERSPDARDRGIVLHRILERFVKAFPTELPEDPGSEFLRIAEEVMRANVPWPAERTMWNERLREISEVFLQEEIARRNTMLPNSQEVRGNYVLEHLELTLVGVADRIDRAISGDAVAIHDYKSGTVTARQVKTFSPQLLLEAKMAQTGAFEGVEAAKVAEMSIIPLNGESATSISPANKDPYSSVAEMIDYIWERFERMISAYRSGQGYTSRLRVEKLRYRGDYDHLARFGEWADAEDPVEEELR